MQCPVCVGSGKIASPQEQELPPPPGVTEFRRMYDVKQVPCWGCNGTGEVPDVKREQNKELP